MTFEEVYALLKGKGSGGSYFAGDGIDITNGSISVKIGEGLEINEETGKIDAAGGSGVITRSNLLVLRASGWSNNTQKVSCYIDILKRNTVDPTLSQLSDWIDSKVIPTLKESDGITFRCTTVPQTNLTFYITSMAVTTPQESIGYSTDGLVRYLPLAGDLIERITGSQLPTASNTASFEFDAVLGKPVCDINNKYITWGGASPLYGSSVSSYTFQCLFRLLVQTNRYPGLLTAGTFANQYGVGFYFYPRVPRLGWNGNGVSGTGEYDDNKWHQAAVTFDGSTNTISAYIDGVLNVSVTKAFSNDISSAALGMLLGLGESSYNFSGYACNFAVYDKALTAAEVAANWQVDVERYGIGE